ncbi:unnamed protein product, partial [Rhizoctonia solani]
PLDNNSVSIFLGWIDHSLGTRRYGQNPTAPEGAQPFYPVEAPQEFDVEGKELDPDAQVWKTYVREADLVDDELVDGWNKSMDVILIFAALFSAISTAFVIESYKSLKPDSADSSSQTLLTISQTLMFIANGSQPSSALPTSEVETPVFKASAKAICVNVLWFLSLSLSVAVSLISMLAKEWCLEFMTGRTGPPGAQARRRQQRWDGLVRWRMKEVLVILPSLIHLSLLLFAIGLCVFLWDVHYGVAIPVVIVTTLAASAYFACTIVPLRYAFCPYGTVLSRFIRQFTNIRPQLSQDNPPHDEVTASALRWMIETCETPRSVDVALQSLAAAEEGLPGDTLQKCNAWTMIKRRFESIDRSEQSEQTRAADLYKRGLEAHPMTRKQADKLNYGYFNENKKLEYLVVGVQSTISGMINDVISNTPSLDPGTTTILKRCTLVGRHYLYGGGISWRLGEYAYAIEVDPTSLAGELVTLLEPYLRGNVELDPVLYCVLSACFAFVMCCNAAQRVAEKLENTSHVLRLVRTYLSGREGKVSESHWNCISDNLILGTLWLWISADYSRDPLSSTSSRFAATEAALETLWAGLMNTMYSHLSAWKRIDMTVLAHGMLYLLANPNHFNLTVDDSQAIESVLDRALLTHHLSVRIQHRHHAQYIQDICHNLATMSDVAEYTPQLLRALKKIQLYAPWDDKYLLPTSEIYVFVVKYLCMTSDIYKTDTYNAYWILEYSPIPTCSPQLVEQLLMGDIITHLSSSLASDNINKQVFATALLGLLFFMSLHEPDRSSPALSTLEKALLGYPGLENSMEQQEEVIGELETKLQELLTQHGDDIDHNLKIYVCRVLEVMLQEQCAPLPEISLVNLETERSVVYPDIVFDSEGKLVSLTIEDCI